MKKEIKREIKREIILRGISGFPVGITIGYFITIFLSLLWGKGFYSPCKPELISMAGSEIQAVLLQALLCGLLGAGFSASSMIWEIEEWSIVKQTGIYFLIASVLMMPAAYLMYWMERSLAGFLSYFGLFALLFVIIWLILFLRGKYNVSKMNANLDRAKQEKDM